MLHCIIWGEEKKNLSTRASAESHICFTFASMRLLVVCVNIMSVRVFALARVKSVRKMMDED